MVNYMSNINRNKEVEKYISTIDDKWKVSYKKLLDIINENIPSGFKLNFQYGMPTYVVSLSIFPEGYLGQKDEPLPFVSLASQKNYISLYHMGLIGNRALLTWFEDEYAKEVPTKLNMGKSCIRFTNVKNIPYGLISELMRKISLEDYVNNYEKFRNN